MSAEQPLNSHPTSPVPLTWLGVWSLAGLLVLQGCGGANAPDPALAAEAAEARSASDVHEDDDDGSAPGVLNFGPVADPSRRHVLSAQAGSPAAADGAAAFNGGPRAHLDGAFAPVHGWPVMPIHMVTLGDGRVMAYGTDTSGKQGSWLHYTIWDPTQGTGAGAFMTLPNGVGTDIFCGAQTLLPGDGKVLLVGGDAAVNGKRNYATADVNLFEPGGDVLSRQPSMQLKRWYATVVPLATGEQVVLGGRIDREYPGDGNTPPTQASYAVTPEVRQADGSWRLLDQAVDEYAYGNIGNAWFYPRAWLKPDGKVFVLAHNGIMFNLDASARGALTRLKAKAPKSLNTLPSVMYAPGKVLSVRKEREAVSIDISGAGEPVVSAAGTLANHREWGNATVLADGKVWVSGGSGVKNELVDVALNTEIWDPATGQWTPAAAAAEPRLYHSAAVLLHDGTVLTGGGGSPGPITQMNGEIYYPPYLFRRDGSGELFSRPKIMTLPEHRLAWGEVFTVKTNQTITRATLVRHGSVTHSFNNDTRFFELPVTQTDNLLTISTPASPNLAPPGYYMLFIWNKWGVPSVARSVRIG